MFLQISFSPKSNFLILFSLLISLAIGEKVLIICTEGCGCVTELGQSVNCSFIPSNQTAVIQSRLTEYETYVATRVIPIGTVFDAQISTEEALSAICPDAAGIAPEVSIPICIPALRPVRTVPNSLIGPEEVNCKNTTKKCSIEFEGGGPNAEFKVSGFETKPSITSSGDSEARALGAFSGKAFCRPTQLKRLK